MPERDVRCWGQSRHQPHRASRWSVLLSKWRLVPLVRLGKTGGSYLAPDLHHHRVDVAPDMHVATATRRHAGQMRQHGASDLVDQRIGPVTPYQLALLRCDPDVPELGLGFGVLCRCL